jgi:hypothetical protein
LTTLCLGWLRCAACGVLHEQKKEYLEEEEKKKNAFSFMLQGWEEKRGHGSPVSGPGYENIEGLVQGQLIRDVFDVKHAKQVSRRRGASPVRGGPLSAPDLAFDKGEVTGEMLDALEDQMRYDEYGNRVKLSNRWGGSSCNDAACFDAVICV